MNGAGAVAWGRRRSGRGAATVTAGLLFALAVQNAVPPFATDMYSPAFPQVANGLGTTAALVGLTLTSFFVGMGLGQVVGGATSDQLGRRMPIVVGGIVCTLAGIVCALAPSIGVLVVARAFQGFGGGVASALTGLVQSVSNSAVAPLASAGGGRTAVPMVLVMIVGSVGAWVAFVLVGRVAASRPPALGDAQAVLEESR